MYTFSPETNRLQLKNTAHLFEKGRVTGDVWRSKGGRTLKPGHHARVLNMEVWLREKREGVWLEMDMGVEVEEA